MHPFEHKIDLMPRPAPERPTSAVSFPVARHGQPGPPFGMLTFHRKIIAAKTEGGMTSILCEYGGRRKWYAR